MDRIAASVILYNPGAGLEDRIGTYSGYVEKLFIVDNSDPPYSPNRPGFNMTYLGGQGNKGMALALNMAAKTALDEGYDWLLTMDQDSFFADEDIKNYRHCFDRFEKKNTTALLGVQPFERTSSPLCADQNVSRLITSGTLLNLRLFEKIGGFDENLFIDQVDFDYCYKAILQGYGVVQFQNVSLHHSLGTVSHHRSFKNLSKTSRSLHSPVRLYYMTRNYLYMKEKYHSAFPEEIRLSKKRFA